MMIPQASELNTVDSSAVEIQWQKPRFNLLINFIMVILASFSFHWLFAFSLPLLATRSRP